MNSIGVALVPGWQRCLDPEWLAGWNPQPFDLGDGTTEVVVMGEGPPLLLLPPLPGHKEAWVGVAWRLARRFRVITFDQRRRFAGPPRWEALLADLEKVADAFAPGRAAVAGHSLGGALAQRWALAHPERVTALVLSSTFARVGATRGHWHARYVEQPLFLASQRWLPERLAAGVALWSAARRRWVLDPGCDARMLAFVRHAIRSMPWDLARPSLTLAFSHDTRAELGNICCPTLLVAGEREAAWVRAAAVELSRLIPGAELRLSPGVAHLHPMSGAAWLAETMTDWLAGVQMPPGATGLPAGTAAPGDRVSAVARGPER